MNAIEAGKLLTVLATITGREPSSAQARGWAFALDDVPYAIAEAALRDAVRAGDSGPITAPVIRRHAAPLLRRLAADVRSARLRNLVPDSWPETEPLPSAVADRLKAEWAATNDLDALASGDVPPTKELRP